MMMRSRRLRERWWRPPGQVLFHPRLSVLRNLLLLNLILLNLLLNLMGVHFGLPNFITPENCVQSCRSRVEFCPDAN